MRKTIGIGVIGLFMGRNMLYVNRHRNSDLFHSEIRAICDTNPERLAENQLEFDVPFATTRYQELMDRNDIDVIGIFAPDHLHMPMIRAALEAGKDVICTKPMVVRLEDALEVCKLVKTHKRKFLVGQTRRYVKHHMEAKALYDSGKIGIPLICEASYVHGDIWKVLDRGAWRYEVPQKMIYGGMCHPVDHLRWYFGDVDEVFAYADFRSIDSRYPTTFPLNVLVNLKFQSGLMGRIMNANGIIEPAMGALGDIYPMEQFCVFGTKGTITNFYARYFENDLRGEATVVEFSRKENVDDFDGKEYSGHLASVLRYVREIEDCILNNQQPTVNEIDGAKCIAICAATEESIRTGKPCKVFQNF